MRRFANILLFLFVIFIISCNDSSKIKQPDLVKQTIVVDTTQQKELTKAELRSIRQARITLDSIRILNAFKNLKEIALLNYEKPFFELINDSTKIVIFENENKYLFIRFLLDSSQSPYDAKIGLYELADNQIKTIIEEQEWTFTYMGDTIRDVNGDGFKDILTHEYASSGCCRRDEYFVRLFNPDKRQFEEEEIDFINPTFFPEEKIIRGVEYGHSGEVPLYKMRWNGMKVDTIEFIYPLPDKKNTFLITKGYRRKNTKGKLVSPLPKEYRNIESIDWFLNY